MTSAPFMAVEEAPESVYLHPGQIYTAAHAAYVTTVLGSCVAVWPSYRRTVRRPSRSCICPICTS